MLNCILPRVTLVTDFVLPDLEYGGVLYDQTFNSAFHDKLDQFSTMQL